MNKLIIPEEEEIELDKQKSNDGLRKKCRKFIDTLIKHLIFCRICTQICRVFHKESVFWPCSGKFQPWSERRFIKNEFHNIHIIKNVYHTIGIANSFKLDFTHITNISPNLVSCLVHVFFLWYVHNVTLAIAARRLYNIDCFVNACNKKNSKLIDIIESWMVNN